MVGLLKRIFGDGNKRKLKQLEKVADQIEALEPDFEELSDTELQQKTENFKERYAHGESLDDMLVEAYAVVREASKRVLNMRPFYVQLLDRKSTRLNSSHVSISYALFCLQKK